MMEMYILHEYCASDDDLDAGVDFGLQPLAAQQGGYSKNCNHTIEILSNKSFIYSASGRLDHTDTVLLWSCSHAAEWLTSSSWSKTNFKLPSAAQLWRLVLSGQ